MWCFTSFHEVMKLKSFEFDVSDVIPANVQIVSPWYSLHIFVNFMKRGPTTKFYGVFDHFSQTDEVEKSLND